ncbi:DUF4230 domain-containing protein [Arthrobacter sp. CAL618]|uniref:DUF4230 domain-containing protein n=1 Tax=Arthrobacter sp. CAL618 TaxID=1055770 RepID=UPI0004062778|nr:DUF4230 domain-containing protein [Arthrobacter sp. CAL618]
MIAKFVRRMTVVVAGLVVVVLAGIGASNMFGFNPFQATQIDRSQPVLLKSIQDISEYHAAVGNFEVVLDIEEDIDWVPGFVAGRRTLFVAAGTVNSHVDFSGLSGDDLTLSADGKSVTVRLPEPEIGKPNVDFDRSYIFGQDRGIVDRITDAIETPKQAELYGLAETKMFAAAEESELRAQAAENTRAMLTGMFGSLGIDVIFLEDGLG